ncbi:PTS glucose transporter subunit IIA [Lachnospiraceae bacterium KK002]
MEHLNMVGYDNIFPPGGLAGNAAIGSVFAGLVDLKQYVYAGPGLITSPVYISPDGSMTNFYFCLITIAVSALAGFAMTYLFSMRNRSQYDGDAAEEKVEKTEGADTALTGKEKDESVASAAIEQDIVAVVDGKSIPIEEVKDGVFSEKMMGEGIAFLPEDGKVVAPCSGKMSVVYDTGHAYGITGGPAGYDVGLP